MAKAKAQVHSDESYVSRDILQPTISYVITGQRQFFRHAKDKWRIFIHTSGIRPQLRKELWYHNASTYTTTTKY